MCNLGVRGGGGKIGSDREEEQSTDYVHHIFMNCYMNVKVHNTVKAIKVISFILVVLILKFMLFLLWHLN